MAIGSIDLDDDFNSNKTAIAVETTALHINEMDPSKANTVLKTKEVAENLLLQKRYNHSDSQSMFALEKPLRNDSKKNEAEKSVKTLQKQVDKRLTQIEFGLENKVLSESTEDLIQQTQNSQTSFPYLAWEIVKLGLAKEGHVNNVLNQHIDEIENAHKDISLLLDLNASLSSLKEEDSELTEKGEEILRLLKNRGIEIKGENAGEIKRLASSQESRLRSEIQIKFTTKVQHLLQQIESLNQVMQNVIRNDGKLKEKANQLTR